MLGLLTVSVPLASAAPTKERDNIMENTYNGWANYETWNVALYIQNEEPLYRIAVNCDSYSDFLFKSHRLRGVRTPDNVLWHSSLLDWNELDAMIQEL